MHTIHVLGAQHAFSPRPTRSMIVSKPVWLAVGLPPHKMARTNQDAYPFMTAEYQGNESLQRCLVGLTDKDIFRSILVEGTQLDNDISLLKTNEGEAFVIASRLKVPLLLISEITDNHLSGWFDDIEPYT